MTDHQKNPKRTLDEAEASGHQLQSAEEVARTDKAWERLMMTLGEEQPSPAWAKLEQFDDESRMINQMEQGRESNREGNITMNNNEKLASVQNEGTANGLQQVAAAKPRKRRMSGRARGWVAGAAAALVVVTAVATPLGNKALAAILGQFRMEQVTEVRESDLQVLFNSVFTEGVSEEAVSRFGEFKIETGVSTSDKLDQKQAAKMAGFELLPESVTGPQKNFYGDGGRSLQLKLNVGEINKTMKQLGAKKLMPESVDGKNLTLKIEPSVWFNADANGMNLNITQQKAPSVEMDSSVGLEDAVDAVVNFPLLPGPLKDSLQNSMLLTNGQLPLPVPTNEDSKSERLQIGGTFVIVSERNYGDNDNYVKEATWVKNGVLTQVSLYVNAKEQPDLNKEQVANEFRSKLQELVGA
ncbi:hypothetical protein [Paenibacillus herberti]|uniref:DUF4367 domain-containing protein n=1 Tax=Paenibacillus herberti TaxID=1619309 RepID=A0A229NYU3_9BACL|nr:hypothetical protein [Paenibacillus herberti]OXM14924.1 hypothetical protein CGZ75_18870 [Paenibacillus herberti]